MSRFLLLLVLGCFQISAQAAIDAYSFDTDEQRDRYNALIDELRCPMCLNTNLAGSDAMIAQDLRREVHRLVVEGQSDEEILDFMYERYGDFILYEPRVTLRTVALWFGPLALLLLALLVGWRMTRGQQAAKELTEEERVKLDVMLSGASQKSSSQESASQESSK